VRDELDDLLDGELDETSDSDSAEKPVESVAAVPAADVKQQKRISDLMGKWQKEQARANVAEAELRDLVKSGGSAPSEPRSAELPPEVQAWLNSAKSSAIDRAYGSDPRFEQYGVDKAQLAGATPEDVQANADKIRQMIDVVESKVRNATLREYGFAPSLGGDTRGGPAKDYSTMSSDDFNAEVSKVLGY
jgi:hypothetical protein